VLGIDVVYRHLYRQRPRLNSRDEAKTRQGRPENEEVHHALPFFIVYFVHTPCFKLTIKLSLSQACDPFTVGNISWHSDLLLNRARCRLTKSPPWLIRSWRCRHMKDQGRCSKPRPRQKARGQAETEAEHNKAKTRTKQSKLCLKTASRQGSCLEDYIPDDPDDHWSWFNRLTLCAQWTLNQNDASVICIYEQVWFFCSGISAKRDVIGASHAYCTPLEPPPAGLYRTGHRRIIRLVYVQDRNKVWLQCLWIIVFTTENRPRNCACYCVIAK